MTCSLCGGTTKVVDSRKECDQIMRARKCDECGYRFFTIEVDEDMYRRRKEAKSNSDKIKECVTALKNLTNELSKLGG